MVTKMPGACLRGRRKGASRNASRDLFCRESSSIKAICRNRLKIPFREGRVSTPPAALAYRPEKGSDLEQIFLTAAVLLLPMLCTTAGAVGCPAAEDRDRQLADASRHGGHRLAAMHGARFGLPLSGQSRAAARIGLPAVGLLLRGRLLWLETLAGHSVECRVRLWADGAGRQLHPAIPTRPRAR